MAGTQHEQTLRRAGYRLVAGVDEVGRGCWAGPVVAAAVVLSDAMLADPVALAGIDDSKALSASARESAAHFIRQHGQIGVGAVPAHLIDHIGIGRASAWAMMAAVLSLPCWPDALLIDWVTLPELPLPQHAMARGDAESVSIAAASIIAKVQRDRLMTTWDRFDARYGWGQHKGYGTRFHQQALARYGPSALHRLSFRPVALVAAAPASGAGLSDQRINQPE